MKHVAIRTNEVNKLIININNSVLQRLGNKWKYLSNQEFGVQILQSFRILHGALVTFLSGGGSFQQ